MVRLTVLTVKKLEFPKSKTASILKITVKSPDLSNRWTDFDEIWHDDTDWPPTGNRPLKFRIFQKITKKSRYLRNGFTDLSEIWYTSAKWVSWPSRPLKNLNFTNPRWRIYYARWILVYLKDTAELPEQHQKVAR